MSDFVDLVAADDDEGDDILEEKEEDEDDGEPLPDGFIEHDEEPNSKRPRIDGVDESAFHASVDQLRAEAEDANVRQMIKEKYGDDDNEIDLHDLGEGVEDEEIRPAANLLPSIKDPKLWLVGCEKDCEEKAVLALIQKVNRLDGTADQLYIQSAFTTPASKNYIYVEAYKRDHAKRAVAGIRSLLWWKIRLVPISEMKDAVSLNHQKTTVKLKQWVRMKSGLYKSDLAQIIGLEDQDTRITIKLIPRIDKGLVSLEGKARQAEGDEGVKKFRRNNKKRKGVRPLQTLFDKHEIEELGGEVTRKTAGMDSGCDVFKGQRFRHGFLIKVCNSSTLILDGAPPTQEELSKFHSRVTADSDNDFEEEKRPTLGTLTEQKQTSEFQKDDRVVVISGDTKNLTGRVAGVFKNTLTMIPDPKFSIGPQYFNMSKVRKYFHVGDHVKVIAGKSKDETGLIVQVLEKENVAVIFSDVSAQELRVSTQDIIESSAISAGVDTLGAYNLHDLVILNRNHTPAVIVKVGVGSFKVMLTTGELLTVKLQDIDKKQNRSIQSALDSQGNIIQFKDVVQVLNGPNKGKQGPIKHIFRSDVFLFSPHVPDNSGIFVSQSKHCLLIGQPVTQPMTPASPSTLTERDRGSGGKRVSKQQSFGKDPWLGKNVVITRGQWKGLNGVVSVATDQSYSVTMAAICKRVTVPRNHVSLNTATGTQRSVNDEPAIFASKTPDRSLSGATPARFDGGVTPARTPSRDGMTPSRDVWSAMTPARESGMTPCRIPRTPHSPAHEQIEEGGDFAEDLYNQPWTTTHPTTPFTPVTPAPSTPFDLPKTPFTPTEHDEEEPTEPPETPFTPATPITPTVPNTTQPTTPVDDDSTPLSSPFAGQPPTRNGENPSRLIVGMVVQGGGEEGQGAITAVDAATVTVQLAAGSKSAPHEQWRPCAPVKNHAVLIVSGELEGKVGKLIGIDNGDGVVQITGQDGLKIISLPLLSQKPTRAPKECPPNWLVSS